MTAPIYATSMSDGGKSEGECDEEQSEDNLLYLVPPAAAVLRDVQTKAASGAGGKEDSGCLARGERLDPEEIRSVRCAVPESYWTSCVLCPFYRTSEKNRMEWGARIKCEGFTDNCKITIAFRSWRDMDDQIEIFCANHYKNCEVYRMIYAAKYDEE